MKRKNASAVSSSRKRKKQESLPLSSRRDGNVDYTKEYKVKSILDEKDGKYLIDWEDDEITGETFEPTWELKANANKLAVDDWKRQKVEKRNQNASPPASSTLKFQHKCRPRKFRRPIVSSSPDESLVTPQEKQCLSSPEPADCTGSPKRDEPEIVESQATTGVVSEADRTQNSSNEPIVELSGPPPSVQAGVYQIFSSSQATASSELSEHQDLQSTQDSSVDKSQSARISFGGGPAGVRVIPDSQTLVEFSTLAPAASTSEGGASQPPSGLQAIAITPAAQEVASSAPAAIEDAQQSPLALGAQTEDFAPELRGTPKFSEAIVHERQLSPTRRISASCPAQETPADDQPSQDTGEIEQYYIHSPQTHEVPWTLGEVNNQGQLFQASPASSRIELRLEDDTPSPVRTPSQPLTQLEPRKLPANLATHFETEIAELSGSGNSPNSLSFQTQIAHPIARSPPVQSREFRSFGPRAQRPLSRRSSPVRPSSHVASPPVRSAATPDNIATAWPAISSSPRGGASRDNGQVMETSQGSPSSSQSLLGRLEAIREAGHANRRDLAPTSAEKSDTVASPPYASQPSQKGPRGLLPQQSRLVSSLIAAERESRSPSVVPAMEPLPEITQEEMNTSERYESLLPQAQENGPNEQKHSDYKIASSLSRRNSKTQAPQNPTSHFLPIGLLGHQRDQYPSMIWYYREFVERLLSSNAPDAQLVTEAERFVERMRHIALHPDLDNAETLTQYYVQPRQQAEWDIGCSAKFRFLKDLFDAIRDQTIHVVILAEPGRILDMLDVFLKGISVPHRRVGEIMTFSLRSDHDGLMVTLVSTADDISNPKPSPADLVIAMDPMAEGRGMPTEALAGPDEGRPILLTLVIPGSVEHIELSLSPALHPLARLRALVSGIWQYRNEAGRLEHDQLTIDGAAERIAEYLSDQDRGEWPLTDLAPLVDLDSQTESDMEHATASDGTSITNKRSFEQSQVGTYDASDQNKRSRIDEHALADISELPITINPQDIEIMHVRDSALKPMQSSASGSGSSLILSDTEQRLQRMLKEAQDRLEEHIQALNDLQYRNEEQRAKLIEAETQRDNAIAQFQTVVTRMTGANNKVVTLKAERTELRKQLEEANAKLLEHSIPERREFEALRLELEQSKAEKSQLEKRLESAKQEADYSREMYQNSSQGAQNLATQNTELEHELAIAQKKATGEQARLRQMGYDAQTKKLRDENKLLKALLTDREAGMKFRDDEIVRLKETNRGRLITRAGSVPRSPRLGSPMAMDGPRGRGSRQGSPATGDLRGKAVHLHPLRNG